MVYVDLPLKSSTDTFSSTDWENVVDNFEVSVPHLITAKGDIAVATAEHALDNLAVGTDYQVLQSRAAATYGIEWSGAVGAFLTKDTQSITSGSFNYITFDTELLDTNSFHSTDTNTDRLTIPFDGAYMLSYSVIYDSISATGIRSAFINYDRSGLGRTAKGHDYPGFSAVCVDYFVTGEFARLGMWQNSGGAINATNITFGIMLLR